MATIVRRMMLGFWESRWFWLGMGILIVAASSEYGIYIILATFIGVLLFFVYKLGEAYDTDSNQ